MRIIELNQIQYRNYSNIHSRRNFGQTVEYSILDANNNKKRLFLGMIDDNNNLCAATLILITQISPSVKRADAPNGFLIDYADYELVRIFTDKLKEYLLREKITFLTTNPMFKYKVYNKVNNVIVNNSNLLDNLYKLDYQSIGYANDFSKYDVIVDGNDSAFEIYKNFNRNTKRNIRDAQAIGVTLVKGKNEDIDIAYDIFKKKTKNGIEFYKNLLEVYNNKDNKTEIFFVKLNPNKYLINCKQLYENERNRNEKLHIAFNKKRGYVKEKILNRKIESDMALEKYNRMLNKAIKFSQTHNEDVIIGTSIIMRNNREIYFLIDGYKEEYRAIHSTHILKWAIIKKYNSVGYRIFNLGEIHKNYNDKTSKYYGQYLYKIGFAGNVCEYPPSLILVINKRVYSAYEKLNMFKFKKK